MNFVRVKQYFLLMRLDKPIGIFLILWPTLWALWLASRGRPNKVVLFIFILGSILMRSAGCVINDIADRRFDGFVERTRNRPLVMGNVSVKMALILFFILLFCAFSLVLLLNRATIFLAFIGAILATSYPFLKRFTYFPQVGLGIAFSWSVPMVFAALTGTVSLEGGLVFFTSFLWPIMYDTLYAMVDRADDVRIGIKSTAILFGKRDKLLIGLLQGAFLLLLGLIGYFFRLNLFYYVSLIGVGIVFIYQQWLIKDRLPADCFKAFISNHWVGFIIFCGITLNYANYSG
ncbi:MAG: ubiA [Gammaproteobacteria bacterium]|jgi:4-hydroxybenzoate polyprenyltransferase|nr:ubiA [Gammaproteobacteria bacterium]